MKTIVRVLLLLSVAIPLARADEWSKTFNLTGRPDLKVESSDADIHVDTWDQATIEAKVTTERYKIGEGGIKISERQTGDQVSIEVRFPHEVHLFNFSSHHVQIDIHMPREGRVNLGTGDGRVRITGLKGELELRSGDGSLETSTRMAGSICSTSTPATVELMSKPSAAPPWVRVGTCAPGTAALPCAFRRNWLRTSTFIPATVISTLKFLW
jgi:hypothetical protein